MKTMVTHWIGFIYHLSIKNGFIFIEQTDILLEFSSIDISIQLLWMSISSWYNTSILSKTTLKSQIVIMDTEVSHLSNSLSRDLDSQIEIVLLLVSIPRYDYSIRMYYWWWCWFIE